MKNFLKSVKTGHTETKNFSYTKGDVELAFSLRTDIKNQLRDFRELLKEGLEDVDNELEKFL